MRNSLHMTSPLDHIEISKRTIRERAVAFSKKHASDRSEASEKQGYWIDFFEIFGVSQRTEGRFEFAATRLSTGNRGWIDLLVPGEMAVEHKSAGEDLSKAMGQLFDYLDSLEVAAQPHLLVACDFQHFYWHDLDRRRKGALHLKICPRMSSCFGGSLVIAAPRTSKTRKKQTSSQLDTWRNFMMPCLIQAMTLTHFENG